MNQLKFIKEIIYVFDKEKILFELIKYIPINLK